MPNYIPEEHPMLGDDGYPVREFVRDVSWGLIAGAVVLPVVIVLFVASRAFWWALVNMWRAFY